MGTGKRRPCGDSEASALPALPRRCRLPVFPIAPKTRGTGGARTRASTPCGPAGAGPSAATPRRAPGVRRLRHRHSGPCKAYDQHLHAADGSSGRGPRDGERGNHLLQSCSMVAHCSDFFQVCASSSFLVLTASSSKLILSCRKPDQKVLTGFACSGQTPDNGLPLPQRHTLEKIYKTLQAVTMKSKMPHTSVYKYWC